ncbi:MAG: cysteine desulfurase [Candidatus Eremiobacteraeota bacterium]|nr:cysteine desulfurase [Candidatus Eremiobacteraeota bacterium]MCW5872745.1 cysteine desulfurase [Candidatus Eremiobacteraeota bacterium]
MQDFPCLEGITYLDSAASSQTPNQVLEKMQHYYQHDRANVHRGAYALSSRATEAYEEARQKVADFLGTEAEQCVFTRGTTDGLNLLARTLPGQKVALSVMEHHSNLVPWQQRPGVELLWIEMRQDGTLDPASLDEVLNQKPDILTLTWVSNVLGTINPIGEIAERCRAQGTILVVDAAQGVPHLPTDVNQLGCHFLVFSGHKMLGPTGIGVLWGERKQLDKLPPYQFGGSMVGLVTREKTTFADLPQRLEAGTPPIAEAIGLGAAIDYLQGHGMAQVREHEKNMVAYALEKLRSIPELRIAGPQDPEKQGGVISFQLGNVHPHDVATILDRRNVCLRAGHHCCQPLLRRLTDMWTPGARAPLALLRASFYLYNGRQDVDRLVDGLQEARKVFDRG